MCGGARQVRVAAYSVAYVPDTASDEAPPWHVLASGDGTPRQVRVGFRSVYLDVVPPGASDVFDEALIEHELREVTFDGDTRLIAKLSGIVDFELVSRRIYASLQLPHRRYALRIIPLEDPSLVLEVQTSTSLSSLTFAEPYFYFGDTVRGTLSRLPAWLE